jgi:inner membrane transporter RhtA
VSSIVVAPLGLTSVDRWTRGDVALGLGIAVLSSVLPYSLELVALRHLAQHVFGILLSLEPVVAALAGLVVLHQVLDAGQVAGMVLVVLASTIVLGAQTTPESPDAGLGPG